MGNSTSWHKHEDGVWHKKNKTSFAKDGEFYEDTKFGVPFIAKKAGKKVRG